MLKTLVTLALAMAFATPAFAQNGPVVAAQARPAQTPRPPQPPQPAQPMPPAAPEPPNAPPPPSRRLAIPQQNVKLDVSITDSASGAAKKRVTMLIGDGRNGQIRSVTGNSLLNVDAQTNVGSEGKILVELTLQYNPGLAADGASTNPNATVNESLGLLLTDGKPTVISESADPRSDRKVTVEVTASVVK
jgi:hypothetical protein